MIEVSGISKKFKTKKKVVSALEDVSFSCEDGKIFGLLGPNGAGKTTALRIMTTLLKPDSGSVKVSGYDTVKQSTEVRKRIGFLTSDMKLSGNLSPDELMNFFGELNHISKEQLGSTKEQLVHYLGMGDFVSKPVEKLSTGMKQKTSIAVSLIHNPQVIIFDEPTNGLDIISSKVVTDFLKDFKKQGKTVIISTHIMPEAEKLCDTIGLIFEGHLIECGTKEELFKKYSQDSIEDIFFALAEERELIKNV